MSKPVNKKRYFDIITLFPQLISPHLTELPFKRAISNGLLDVNLHNLRNFARDERGTVDEEPYGGGVGMILMVQPIFDALSNIYEKNDKNEDDNKKKIPSSEKRIIVLSPKGKTFTQEKAEELLNFDQITFVSGRYEGFDARVLELNKINPNFPEIETLSVGNYILSGGEIPALAVMESITRLIPSVLQKPEALETESFTSVHGSIDQNIEYPQYTKPNNFKDLKVPQVLLSGNHAEIKKWKRENTQKI